MPHRNKTRLICQIGFCRGSRIAGFLTDENASGPIVKSVKELHKFDREGIEICRTLALKYATQLWEMVEAHKDNSSADKRDPYFP
jgi:hypothetical protein